MGGARVIFADDYHLLRILFIMERILCNSLARGFFSPYTMWEFFECLKNCLPNGAKILAPFKSKMSTDFGRARAFLRSAVNEKSVHDYLSALIWDKVVLFTFSFRSESDV